MGKSPMTGSDYPTAEMMKEKTDLAMKEAKERTQPMPKGDIVLTAEEAEKVNALANRFGGGDNLAWEICKIMTSKLSAAQEKACEPSFDVIDARTMENLVRPLSEWIQRRDALRNEKPCPECGGMGYIQGSNLGQCDDQTDCPSCSGTGKVKP